MNSNAEPNQEFSYWIRAFGTWLFLSVAGKSKQELPKTLIEHRRYMDVEGKQILDGRLSLLNDDDPRFPHRPGAIATWNLVNYQAKNGGVLVTLDNLYKLSLQLDPSKKSSDMIRRGLQRSLGLTHRFQVVWIFRSASNKLRLTVIDAFDIDLASQFIDESAFDVVRIAALEAFSMRPIPSMSWRERIYHFPWENTLKDIAPKKNCPKDPKIRRLCKRCQNVTLR